MPFSKHVIVFVASNFLFIIVLMFLLVLFLSFKLSLWPYTVLDQSFHATIHSINPCLKLHYKKVVQLIVHLDSTAIVWFCHLHFHHNHSLFSFFTGKLLIQIGQINKYWITHVWVRNVVSHNALCHLINLAPIFSVVSREAWGFERKKKNNKHAVVTGIVGYKYTLSIIQITAH